MASSPGPSFVESLARGSPEHLMSVTPGGRILSWTLAAELAFGYGRAEAIGRQLVSLAVPSEGVDDLQRALDDALATGDASTRSIRRRKDGSLTPVFSARIERRGVGADVTLAILVGTGASEARIAVAREQAPAPAALAAAAPADPARALLARARAALEADALAVLVPDAVAELVPTLVDAAPGAPVPFPIGRGFATLAAPGGGLLVEDAAAGPYATLVGIPLVADARVVGVLQACYHVRRALAPADARALQLAAEAVSHVVAPRGFADSVRADLEELRRAALRATGGTYSREVMLQQLVETLVPRFADWAAADVAEVGAPARRVAAAHRDAALTGRVRALAPVDERAPAPASAHRALRSAQPEIELDAPIPPAGRDEPAWAHALRELGCGSHVQLPFIGRTRLLGALTLVRVAPHRFSPAEAEWAREIARTVSLELENAMLLDHLQRQRDEARHATERARLLHALSSALSEPLTPGQVTQEAVAQARAALEASGGAIAVLSDDHATFEVTSLVGDAAALTNALSRFPIHASLPLADAARSNDLVLVEHLLASAPRYPHLVHGRGVRVEGALAALPLIVDGRTLGALGLVFPQRRVFSHDDIEFLRSLARLVADALERARLYNAERAARAQADSEARRSVLLADASRILNSSFDYRATLEAAARLIVPQFGDWCVVYLQEKDGDVRALSAVHADPARADLMRELLWRPPPHPDAPGGIGKVLRQGTSEVFHDLPDQLLETLVPDAESRRIVRQLGLRSQVVVPLVARGRTLGAIALCSSGYRRLTAADLQLVEELARRAALAVDNARLYHEVEEAYRRKEESMSALRESEERYRILVDGATEYAIFLLDPDGRIASWNPGAQRMLGYAPEEVVGKTTHMFFTPEDVAARAPERDLDEALLHGRCEQEGWRIRKDGTRYWANVVVTVLRDEDGKVRGYSKLHRDITERKRAREELDHARTRVAQHEKLSTMGTLVSGVAHEIRTPLTAIANSVHLLRFQADRGTINADAVKRHTDLALEGVERINRLVQDLRRFKRVETGGRVQTSLDTVVDEALALFRAAHRGRVEVRAELHPTPPCDVDRSQIQQAVINLLQNASEALPHGGEIHLRTEPTPQGGGRIVVADKGIGMPPDIKARMFEEFFTTKTEGTGLGLSIVRRILEIHNGNIDCESTPGHGTTFTLTLPPAMLPPRPRSS